MLEAADLLAPLAREPARSAIVLDVDGTLAPIVARPELAEVPAATRTELRRLVTRYLLVACVSGRSGEDAERLVDVPVAMRESKPARRTRSGTTTIPPPTPKRALMNPDATPMPPRTQNDGLGIGTVVC